MAQPRFLLRHMDLELHKALETTVPPMDLGAVSAFRTALQKHQKQAQRQLLRGERPTQVQEERAIADEKSRPQT